jgi:uncharacterized membrane protein
MFAHPILKFAVILFLVDLVWIVSFKSIHTSVVERVQNSPFKPRFQYGIAFYLVAATVWYHIVFKKSGNTKDSALLGLGMYATYDLTLLALFERYPVKYAFADIFWGTFALGLTNEIFKKL